MTISPRRFQRAGIACVLHTGGTSQPRAETAPSRMEPGCSRGSPCSKPRNHAALRAAGALSIIGEEKANTRWESLKKLRELLPAEPRAGSGRVVEQKKIETPGGL